MSGGYKYADVGVQPGLGTFDPTLGCVILGSIIAQRAAEAAIEAARRLEAEEATLAAGLNKSKAGCNPAAESVRGLLAKQKSNMLPADQSSLTKRLTEADASVAAARTHVALQEAVLEYSRMEKDISRACRRKETEDLRTGKSPGMTAFRNRFQALKQQVGSLLDGPTSGPLGPAGAAAAVKTAFAAAGGALQTNNEAMTAGNLDRFEEAVLAYEDQLRSMQEAHERTTALAKQAQSEASAIIVGLKADPIVMRWHSAAVEALESDLSILSTVGQSDVRAAMQMVAAARESSEKVVKEASGAQMKADQRDYIARSISSTLADMGFTVSEPQPEHPGHPATATIVHAATVTGKAIAVSVPVEGEVWYNVEGYVKSVDAKVGGGEAAVCDEAEAVIEQMHEALAAEFHVEAGELRWDGKDPNRKLRAAKSLPSSGTAARGK